MLVVVNGCVVSGVRGVFPVVSTHFVHLIVHLRRFLCLVVVVAVVVVWRWLAERWSPDSWCCCRVVVRAVRRLECLSVGVLSPVRLWDLPCASSNTGVQPVVSLGHKMVMVLGTGDVPMVRGLVQLVVHP